MEHIFGERQSSIIEKLQHGHYSPENSDIDSADTWVQAYFSYSYMSQLSGHHLTIQKIG